MTALAANTSVLERDSHLGMPHELGAAASADIFVGSLVVVEGTNGFIQPGTTALSLVAAGVSLERIDNSSGADGDLDVKFRSGIFKFQNDGGTPVVQADVGTDCFILDDNTVTGDNTGRSRAGTVYKIDTAADNGGAGVWVAIGFPAG